MEVNVNMKLLVAGMTQQEQTDCLAETYEVMSDGARRAFRKETLADYDDRDLLNELKLRGYNLKLQPAEA